MSDLLHWLLQLDPLWVYCIIFLFAFIENIFPPSPSDSVIVFGGALAAMEKGNFFFALFSATLGSLLGFMVMYAVGRWFGNSILEKKKISFIPLDGVHTIEKWFARYGYWLIVANRFLSGTRAVISLFAGMSNLDLAKTTALSTVSALAWNGILVYAGYTLGHHWEDIGGYLQTYSEIITGVVLLALGALLIHWLIKRRKRSA